MSYNIEMGKNWPRVRDLIRANPVDILCLQEIPDPTHPDRELVRPERIIRDLDLPHDLHMLWDQSPVRMGNMTLVRDGQIEQGQILQTPLSQPYGMANKVRVAGASLTVLNIHLTPMLGSPALTFAFSEIFRLREAPDLTRRYGHAAGPVVALGDFNTFWPAPGTLAMRRRWTDCRAAAGGRRQATRPTYGLPFVIDHIYLRGPISPLDYQVLPGGGSDHRAITATLRVPITPRAQRQMTPLSAAPDQRRTSSESRP